MKNVKYISGISGGSWVTLNYVFSQSVSRQLVIVALMFDYSVCLLQDIDDSILLGPISKKQMNKYNIRLID